MRYRVKATIAHRELAGRIMILRPDDPTLWSLNPTGQVVWRGLLKGRSIDSLVRAVAREFDI
ncbi:MAG TPA: PqqD family protein, partial [Candidatus Xenobia bacterium]